MNATNAVAALIAIKREILGLVDEAESIVRDLPIKYGTDIAYYADDTWIRDIRINTTRHHEYMNVCADETMDDTIDRLRQFIRRDE